MRVILTKRLVYSLLRDPVKGTGVTVEIMHNENDQFGFCYDSEARSAEHSANRYFYIINTPEIKQTQEKLKENFFIECLITTLSSKVNRELQ